MFQLTWWISIWCSGCLGLGSLPAASRISAATLVVVRSPSSPSMDVNAEPTRAGLGVAVPSSGSGRLDPTARVDAKVYVTPQRVRMVLSQFTDDLVWLHGMEADEQGLFSAEQLREYYLLHKSFLGENIQVLDAQGNRLPAVLVDEGPYPFDDQLLREGATEFHLVKRRMNFTYEYTSPTGVLGTFTIKHSVVDENFLYPAELSLELFQGESDLPLNGKLRLDVPMTVDLDWDDPVPSLQASDEEKQAWLAKQDERLLGVTNFGAVYLWAYVEPRHLRVEILIPINVLATLFELESQEADFLNAEEMVAAQQRIRRYFSSGNPVRINDQVVEPVVQRIDFFPADQRDFALRQALERISTANGRVGLSLLYPYREVPREILLSWDKFSYALSSVQAYLFSGDQVQSQTFSRQLADNRWIWKNQGEVREPAPVIGRVVASGDLRVTPRPQPPLLGWVLGAGLGGVLGLGMAWRWGQRLALAAGLVGGLVGVGAWLVVWPLANPPGHPTVSPEAGDAIAEQVLSNIYRAFDFVQEDEIYTALGESAGGAKLRELYLQMLRDLRVEEQGGAVSRIEEVEIVAVEPVETQASLLPRSKESQASPSIAATYQRRIRWNLSGLIEHWGHSHQRTNQYEAIVTIADEAGQWKLVDLNIESQAMGTTQPRPNRFRPAGTSP